MRRGLVKTYQGQTTGIVPRSFLDMIQTRIRSTSPYGEAIFLAAKG